MKIFVLLSRFPYPLEKGDKLRAYHQIKQLSKNHQIVLCALSVKKVTNEDFTELKKFCEEIHILRLSKLQIFFSLFVGLIFTRYPLQVAYFYNKSIHKKIKKIIDRIQPDHIYCQLIRVSEYVKQVNGIPKTLDYMDALSSGMKRRLQTTKFYMRPFLDIEALRLKRYEHFIFKHFDNRTIISEQDRKLIVNAKNEEIEVIPNGVNFNYFYPKTEVKKDCDILFTGNMSYPPNVVGVLYIVNKILPIIHLKMPNCRLIVAGANPHPSIKTLASEKVMITGWVDDIREYYWKSRVMLAPMQIGSGLQNKLLEALAMRVACVTSELANNALDAKENQEILIGHSAEDYAEKVIQLLQDQSFADKIAENGYHFVKKNYDWAKNCQKLEQVLKKK